MFDFRSRLAQMILAILVVAGFFLALFIPVLKGSSSLDQAMGQTLQNMFILVVGYYFGSSSSAAKKDDVIAAASVAAQISAPTAPAATVKIDDSTPVKVEDVKESQK